MQQLFKNFLYCIYVIALNFATEFSPVDRFEMPIEGFEGEVTIVSRQDKRMNPWGH